MPINRLLKDGQYTSKQIELLNDSFSRALNLLSVADRNDPLCDLVARTVIEVGAAGTMDPRKMDPRKIAEIAVARINLR